MQDQTPQTDATSLNDRDLLRRFVQDADEAAFAEIVRRHQGLVMGVCRRVIGNTTDVDDAFQATFIALARRPKQIRSTVSLSSWLYSVAWRTSVRLVRQRRKHPVEELTEHPPDKQSEALDRIANAQDCLVLDEELNYLPTKYREVLVMTYFASQTSQQIADQLNVSKGTVDGRIREARNVLRVRLARRGVAIGALAFAAGMSTGASAAASPALLESTLQLGGQTLSGSVPGTTDLSHLEPLIRPETIMTSSKLILGSVLCASAVVGLVAANGQPLGMGDDESPKVNAVVAEDSPDSNSDDDPFASGGGVEVSVVAGDSVDAGTDEFVAATDGTSKKGGAKFKPYPADARPVEKWMHELLDEPVRNLDFPGDVPLSEVLQLISRNFAKPKGDEGVGKFGLNICVDAGELSQVGMNDMDDVIVTDVYFDGITLRNALKLILDQTIDENKSPEPLTYVIQNEVMLITTVEKAESDEVLVTRVYRVGELLDLDYTEGFAATGGGAGFMSIPANPNQFGGGEGGMGGGGGLGGGGMQPEPPPPTLATLVIDMTSPPCHWLEVDGEGGAVRIVGQTIVVRQTPKGHEEVVRLLNLLYESAVDQE